MVLFLLFLGLLLIYSLLGIVLGIVYFVLSLALLAFFLLSLLGTLFPCLLRWLLLDCLCVVFSHFCFLLVFPPLLDLRDDCVPVFIHVVHLLLVAKSLRNLVDGSVDDVNEGLKGVLVERVYLRQV